jgi:hypothetical protein
MTDSNNTIIPTPADIDRSRREADVAAGRTEEARLTERIEARGTADRPASGGMGTAASDPDHLDRMAAGSQAALARETPCGAVSPLPARSSPGDPRSPGWSDNRPAGVDSPHPGSVPLRHATIGR